MLVARKPLLGREPKRQDTREKLLADVYEVKLSGSIVYQPALFGQ
jgi:hypothetical protein